MWLSRLLIAAILALATACSGLAVKPLGSSLSQQDLGVVVADTAGRNGQIYTRNLTRLLGDTSAPKFQLKSSLSSSSTSSVTVRGSTADFKKKSMTAAITLVDTSTGKTVMRDSMSESTTLGTVTSYYAQARSDKHADERISQLLAKRVAIRVQLYLIEMNKQ
ncbi:MAG TPA: hypothetical protein DD665_09140 [Alphaproteobacteria bacterium]|jgi:hypothetical protein|nr:hypothetical protein [Alphaproteobacteria bacterium]HBP73729.1 hypothetical protein [Alphaproteobacteria bacterium]HCD80125.1 hypothetical protein [Alphaproteobacteria bacterium]|tara:strand:+ start:1425 stop:1913 length:489 start_codon:yes stop_codon:yes gene_type:complete